MLKLTDYRVLCGLGSTAFAPDHDELGSIPMTNVDNVDRCEFSSTNILHKDNSQTAKVLQMLA